MTNSNILKFLKKDYKIVFSWLLLITMIIVGINWPDFEPKADIISDLGLKYITTDIERPYTVLTAEIEGSLTDVSYYLYQTNAPIYFFSDLKKLGLRANSSDINSENISIAKYKYNAALSNWELFTTEILTGAAQVSNVGPNVVYGGFTDNQNFYKIASIAGSYGVLDVIDDFGLSSYVPDSYGEYIIGYCGETTGTQYTTESGTTSVEGSAVLNKNYINYEKFSSDIPTLPIYAINNSNQVDTNLELNQFYRAINLFNSNLDAGTWLYQGGSDTVNLSGTSVSFDFRTFNCDANRNESGILNKVIPVPERYENDYNTSVVYSDFYANTDNLTIDYVANELGLLTNSTITTLEDSATNTITFTINNAHKVVVHVDNLGSKKITGIEMRRESFATDYISLALKVPMIQYTQINGERVNVGKFVYIILKEKALDSNETDASYQTILNAAQSKNVDSNFNNRLMIFSNYSDYDYNQTYTRQTVSLNNTVYDTYFVSDGFLNDSNYIKDIYLRAYSSKTNLSNEDENGYEKVVDITNGVTTYSLYGQLMGYLPETKTIGVNFRLTLGQGEQDSALSHLYVDTDGRSIYYSPADNSSERLELVNIENESASSKLKLRADNITKYRLIMENINAFSNFGITASAVDNLNNISKSININLIRDNVSLVEMYLDNTNDISFKQNWEKLSVEDLVTSLPIENRYPALPASKTEINSPFATLINYGEYQLLLYTNNQPIFSSDSLVFNASTDIEVWRYYNKNWIYENYASKIESASIALPQKAGLNSIDFINYSLSSNRGSVVLTANEVYDDGSPKLRTVKIPQLASSDANQYIFVNNSIGYYAFTSAEKIVANGNSEVTYPSSGHWYVLVQNSWVEISEETAIRNNFANADKTFSRSDFEKKLRYTNDGNSAWTNIEEWGNWSTHVDYFKYIPIYLATSGYDYIIYETDSGFESLEYLASEVGEVSITKDGVKFEKITGDYNGIILKRYDYKTWVNEDVSTIKASIIDVNGNYIFNRPCSINSILYSNENINYYGESGESKEVISSIFSQSLIVSESLATADLTCTNPVSDSNEITIDGVSYPYVVLTSEVVDSNSTYVTYISNQPLKYTTAGSKLDVVIEDYPVEVYRQVWDNNINQWKTPELLYDVSADNGVIDSFTTAYSEVWKSADGTASTVTAIYNQYPNGRVDKFDSNLTSKQEGHFVLSVKEDNSDSPLPENAYEIYYDSTGKEYQGEWNWKWSDNGPLVDYYYTNTGVKTLDTKHEHRYYKIITFEASGNKNEFVNSGEYLNFFGGKTSMGSLDIKGNWINEKGIVVTPSGNYGYYDNELNILSTRPVGIYYFAVEENGRIVAKEATIKDNTDSDISSRIINICSSSDIKWINRDIEAFEDVPIPSDQYNSVTFMDSSISAIIGDFVAPDKISSMEYIEPRDSVDNYWITFFDSCSNIYNPFSNGNVGLVAKDISYKFYIPNFGNVQSVITGMIPQGGTAFDVQTFDSTKIIKPETNWYTESVVSNDDIAPIISSVYMLNHAFKIIAEDPGAYATVFDSQGNRIYKEYTFENVNLHYQYVPTKEYNNALNKDAFDNDGIAFYQQKDKNYYKLLENNNVTLVSFALEDGLTVEKASEDSYQFLYTEVSVAEGFSNTEYSTVGNLSIPTYVYKNNIWYRLSSNYYLVDNELYREVESNQAYEIREAIPEDKVKENFYLTQINDNVIDTEHGEARNIIASSFDYYFNGRFVATIPINQKYTYDDGTNRWGVLYSIAKSHHHDAQTGVDTEIDVPLVQVMTYDTVMSYKYLIRANYFSETHNITRLLKILNDSDIQNIVSSNGTSWNELISTKDAKGLNQYYDTLNSLWDGYNIEAISGTTIGDDGYLYRDGSKVSAEAQYDENGNPINFEISGIDKFYVTIEKDFETDIDFSYDDGTGNIVSFKEGDFVSSKLSDGSTRTIPLVDNQFNFPVDISTGTITLNAYVLDKAGNKSSSINGPWTLKRNDLAATKDWQNYFVAGNASDAIISEIQSAILANTSDTKAPEITGIFLYKGTVYIVATDEDDEETGAKASGIGIAGTYNYIFRHTNFANANDSTLKAFNYYSTSGMASVMQAQTAFSRLVDFDLGQYNAYFECIKDSQGKIQTAELDLSAFDIARNQSDLVHVQVSEDDNNSVLFGNVSQNIYEMLLAARGEGGNEDKIPPVIQSIYVLNGVLYVEATDNLGIKDYGYKWMLDSSMAKDTTGVDDNGNPITIREGADIPKGTIIWHGAAQQAIKTPTKMIIYVEDNSGNASYETVVISSNSQLLYGTVSDEIMQEINGGSQETPSNVAPTITNVYTYKGYLYFEGYDENDNLATWCYGFKPLDNMKLNSNYQGYNSSFQMINIPAGETIKSNQLIYKKVNSQEINIPINITISLRDTLGLETAETFYIFKDNYVYKGKAPDDIKGDIENPDGPGGGGTTDPDKPTPTPIPDPDKPIDVPEDFDDIDWTLYDYLFEVLDKDTNRVVYSIRQDEASSIDCPRLENSVLYNYKISAIKEEDDSILLSTTGQIRMNDTISPTITKIWYSKNRVYVSAYDLGGFDETPFSFVIEGSRDTTDKYISNNNAVVLSGETITVKVRDAAGNIAWAKVTIDEKTTDILYESLNPKDYLYINSNETKSLAYWYAYINTKYGIDVENTYLSQVNKSDNLDFEIKNNNVYLNLKGDGVITFYDNKTNRFLGLNLRTLNTGKSYRSIVVQTGSELDVSLAFKNKLLEQFGTIDGLSWYADGDILTRTGSTVGANKQGVGQIKFVYNNTELVVYVLVVDSISKTVSSCDLTKENFAYTYLLKDNVNIADALRLKTPEEANNIITENMTKGVNRSNNQLNFSTSGVKTLNIIDCVTDNLGEVKFEVIAITPYLSTFTDIIGSSARADIETLCEKGVIGDYPDNKYKPSNKMTTKEFLSMINKLRLSYDSDFEINKIFTNLNLSEKDFDYYSSQNILINMTQDDVDNTIGTYTLNKAITFEEVVKLISATILYDKYHNETGITAPDGLSDCAQQAVHLISMGIINKNDDRNGTRELTRAEIAYMLTKTIKFLEL